MKNIINLDWLRSVVYYVQLSNQIPSILYIKNIYLTITILVGIISSIVGRSIDIDVILAPAFTFIYYNIIIFSILFILYIQCTFIFRVGHMIKYVPNFIKLIKTGNILNIKIISSYYIINIVCSIISLWVISRIIVLSNLGDLYILFLILGLAISSYLFYKYNKNITELNYNIKRYPLWMISAFSIIILLLWILIPISIIKILEKYSVLLENYNIYLNNSIKMSMNRNANSSVQDTYAQLENNSGVVNNVTESSVSRSEAQTNSTDKTTYTSTRAVSTQPSNAHAISTAILNESVSTEDNVSIQTLQVDEGSESLRKETHAKHTPVPESVRLNTISVSSSRESNKGNTTSIIPEYPYEILFDKGKSVNTSDNWSTIQSIVTDESKFHKDEFIIINNNNNFNISKLKLDDFYSLESYNGLEII